MPSVVLLSDNFVNGAVGLRSHGGVKYQTDMQRLTGYIPPGSTGINHGEWAELIFHLYGV